MKNIFLIITLVFALKLSLLGQDKYVFYDEVAGIKCHVYDFEYYFLVDIQNLNKCPIFVPDIFYLIGDFNQSDSYFTNDISQHPFLDQIVSVKKIKQKESCGFLIEDHYKVKTVQFLIGYTKKEIKSGKVMNFIDKLDYKLISQSD